jgi:hypothetical protein
MRDTPQAKLLTNGHAQEQVRDKAGKATFALHSEALEAHVVEEASIP